jgi:lipid-binding SYLF domain-containing protein
MVRNAGDGFLAGLRADGTAVTRRSKAQRDFWMGNMKASVAYNKQIMDLESSLRKLRAEIAQQHRTLIDLEYQINCKEMDK